MDESATLCRKCFLKEHKMSKKNIDRIVLSNWREQCEKCGHIDRVVIDIREEDDE